jgi:hypothetical protein
LTKTDLGLLPETIIELQQLQLNVRLLYRARFRTWKSNLEHWSLEEGPPHATLVLTVEPFERSNKLPGDFFLLKVSKKDAAEEEKSPNARRDSRSDKA